MSYGVRFYMMNHKILKTVKMSLKPYLVAGFWRSCEIFFKTRHIYEYEGLQNIPKDKAVLLVGNHVSWIDWFALQLPIERQINFLIDKDIYNWRFFNRIFRIGELIPVSSKAAKDSFFEASKRLKNGKIVAIFPEGSISNDKYIAKFNRGYEYIDRNGAVLVPFFIDGLFGSIFSRYKEKNKKSFFKRREIKVIFGKPILEDIKADELREIVKELKR